MGPCNKLFDVYSPPGCCVVEVVICKANCNQRIVSEGGLQKRRVLYWVMDLMIWTPEIPNSCLWLYWLLRYGYCKYL